MRRVAIVQARSTSSRLPGKVFADLAGAPLLKRLLERVGRAKQLDDIVVATTTNREDDGIVAIADSVGARWSRGSEHDVLGRVAKAASEARADVVVRICGDCPLLDASIVDRAVCALVHAEAAVDFVSTEPPMTFPRGLDVEALFGDVLARVERMATSRPAREHVTYFIYGEAPSLFRRLTIGDAEDNSDQRWTVDTADDLAFVRKLYGNLDLVHTHVPYQDVIAYVRARPGLRAINAHVVQKDPSKEA